MSGVKGEAEDFCDAFRFYVDLAPGEVWSVFLEAALLFLQGRDSYSTLTAAWMLMLFMEELCGAKATMEGLMLQL